MSKSELKRLAIQCPEVQALLERLADLERIKADWDARWENSLKHLQDDCDNHQRQKHQLREENARLRAAIDLVISFDRNRGYPTGPEWMGLVDKIRAALGEE